MEKAMPAENTPEQSSWFNRCWRVIATGFCFSLFGLGGLLLSGVWFNLTRLAVRDPARRNQLTQSSIRHSFRFFLATTRFSAYWTTISTMRSAFAKIPAVW